jgi:plasmid stabilization system protein ParE
VNIVWTAEARRSLRAIQRFLVQDSEFYAERVVTLIIDRVEAAASHPGRGHPVHEYPAAPLREVHESSYRIIYLIREDALHVVTIVHFKQVLKPGRLRGV